MNKVWIGKWWTEKLVFYGYVDLLCGSNHPLCSDIMLSMSSCMTYYVDEPHAFTPYSSVPTVRIKKFNKFSNLLNSYLRPQNFSCLKSYV